MKKGSIAVVCVIIILIALGYVFLKDGKVEVPFEQDTYVRPTPDEPKMIYCVDELGNPAPCKG